MTPMTRTTTLVLTAVAVLGGAAWFFWPAPPAEPAPLPPESRPKSSVMDAMARATAAAALPPAPASSGATAAHRSAAAARPAMTPEQLHRFELFVGSTYFFNPHQAAQVGLSDDDCVALQMAIWETKAKVDQLLLERGQMAWNGPNQATLSVRLDDAAVANLRAQFADAASDAIGAEKWQAFQGNDALMAELDGGMMGWGQYATTYTFELTPPDAPDHEPTVKIDIMSDKDLQVMHGQSFPRSVFSAIYGPIAGRLGW
jgi:hypothetical protein